MATSRIIGVTELQRKFRAIFDDVANRDIPYILTRGSRAEVVMIPYAQFLKYQGMEEDGVLQRFDLAMEQMARVNARHSDEEVEQDVQVAIAEVRRSD